MLLKKRFGDPWDDRNQTSCSVSYIVGAPHKTPRAGKRTELEEGVTKSPNSFHFGYTRNLTSSLYCSLYL